MSTIFFQLFDSYSVRALELKKLQKPKNVWNEVPQLDTIFYQKMALRIKIQTPFLYEKVFTGSKKKKKKLQNILRFRKCNVVVYVIGKH